MKKKNYEAPVVQKVKVSIGEAVLANCNTSPLLTPVIDTVGCVAFPDSCFIPPGI